MKVVIFGSGSIGARQAALLQKHFKHDLYAYRSGKGTDRNKLGLKELLRWKDLRDIEPDVAFITNPTKLHVDTALRCAREGMHLFIEKPLGSDLSQLQPLLRVIRRKKLASYVAYVLRFHPVVKYIKNLCDKHDVCHMRATVTSYLPSWTPRKNYMNRYSTRKKMGGGVVYDLSHEIDLVGYLLGDVKKIEGQYGRRSDVTIDAEDYADILMIAKKGPVNVHMNFLSHFKQRLIDVDFKDRFVRADLLNFTVEEFRRGKLTKKKKFTGNLQDCFVSQLKYFFQNLKHRRMMNDCFEAAPLIRLIHDFKR